ncbi:hypothetical protein AN963_24125 [Brevibacillus choshinensis]|uniref:DUF4184 family protein n=1 Tax=Brevibacillus choshinensis TaxID=54911 RepID=A0ABR5N1X6_BRECH|nr:DUF4184 family protein [Brevibacillus choshinensis]KQL44489.1 hypothetical protein AN963_24125 [Brevibacillus choshinensis]
MPFTFAHPAIVLPLRQHHYFHFPALLIGSMAPDYEYFFRMQAYSTYSHTIVGVFYFDIPLVIMLWLLYTHVVKRPLLHSLPAFIGKSFHLDGTRQSTDALRSWRSSVIFLYSALLGIISHLVWDAFTHKGAFAVARLPFLTQHLSLGGIDLPVYKVLQHGSTCVGFAAIAFVIWRCGKGIPTSTVKRVVPAWLKWLYWLGIATGGVAVACLHLLATKGSLSLTHLLSGIVPFLSGCMITLIVLSWFVDRFTLKK